MTTPLPRASVPVQRDPAPLAARRPYPERDFGIGYGRSSGYGRQSYVRAWRPGVFSVR